MRTILNLNQKWAFSKEAKELPAEMPENWYWVNLPHTWNAIDGQDGGSDYYRGTCYYAKELQMSELPDAEEYYLEFGGVNSSADVYLNGNKLAHHDGGYSTFRVSLTEQLQKNNLLVVAVDNSANDRVYPQNADFTFYGGIYRSVNLIAVPKSHFDLENYGGPGMRVTPEIVGGDAKVEIQVMLTGQREGQTLWYRIMDREGNQVCETKTDVSETVQVLRIPGVHLWQGRKDPYLYRAEVSLSEAGETFDTISSTFGCRTFEINAAKGFLLNGESYPLRGVSRHQDWLGIGNALLPEHHEEDIRLICEVGATTVRLAHYQHDAYFYQLCDEAGLVVWAEIPYISTHIEHGRENTISQMRELVTQNYNHPSIVVWGLSNEITMMGASSEDLLENHRILNDMVHEMDSTRLTVIAVVSMCETDDPDLQIPDVVSYNHYFGWYGGDTSMNGPWFDAFHEKFPNIPIGVSEYGCEALNWHTSDPKQGDYTEEYQAYYHEELIKQLYTRQYLWATHVWNMFDFGADARNEGGENGQNHKGLVTFDRKYKKDAFYAYKAWLSKDPFVHICGKRYVKRAEDITKVTVYSNQPWVELYANDKSLGKQENNEHFFYFDVPNEGTTKLLAVAGDYRDESFIQKVDTFCEEYRLKEKGAILNWFDITEPEGYFSLNDKVSDIMAVEEGKELFLGMMKQANTSMELNDKMMQMMGGFTVLRLVNLLGVTGGKMDKESLLALNEKLNAIRKNV